MNVKLHIERLVLNGLPLAQRDAVVVQKAVVGELTRLIEGGLAPDLRSGGAVPEVPAGPVSWSPGGNPRELGRQVARSVYGGLGR
jgi:hypothetical protein